MQNKAGMTRCTEDIMTLKNKYMQTFVHTWMNIEFGQEVLAQLPSIEDIDRLRAEIDAIVAEIEA